MKQIRVLHIDDEPDLLADVALALARSDILVESALSFTGWRKLLRNNPDVILLDIDMPEKSGFDLLADLKSRSALRNIPVLFLTAHSEKSTLLRGLRQGLDDYVTKPCDPEELALRIAAAAKRVKPTESVLTGDATVLGLLHLDDLQKSDQAQRLDSILEIFKRTACLIEDTAFRSNANTALPVRRDEKARDLVLFSAKADEFRTQRILRAANRLLGGSGMHMLVPDGPHLERRPTPYIVAFSTDAISDVSITGTLRLATKDQLFHA
ncbi:MAG: response regulator [Spirochaetia bacterium]|nr:response regulator [Spirochaetia bacterium]